VPATPRHNDNNIHNNYYNYNTSNNKNLAIANRSRVSYAQNTLRASIGLNITP